MPGAFVFERQAMKSIAIYTGTAILAAVLAVGVSSPAQAATPKATALSVAASMKNKPYISGGATTKGFDCSGLTQYAYGKAGKTLPRTAQAQYNATRHVSLSAAQPGDLLFFGHDSKHITHVGVFSGYVGGKGYMWNANTGSYRGRKVVNAPTTEYRLGGNIEYAGQVK